MNKHISILGSGWLGLELGKYLTSNDYNVSSSTTTESKFKTIKDKGITPYLTSIKDIKQDSEFLKSNIMIVCTPSKKIGDFKHFISALEQSPVSKIVFISSTSVYKNSNTIVNENSEVTDSSLVQIENLFKNNKKLNTTILRLAGLIGEDRNPANFFTKDRVIPNPAGFINLVHRKDCIAVIEQLIKNEVWNDTFNVVSDNHQTRRAFYTTAIEKLHSYTPMFEENSNTASKIIDNAKIKSLLNYSFVNY